MTEEQKEYERIRALARAVFGSLTTIEREMHYVQQIHKKYHNHPAFKKYVEELNLQDKLDKITLIKC